MAASSVVSPPSAEQVTAALARVNDPEIRRPITELGMVKSVDVGPDGNPYWAYYSDGIGPRLELVSRAAKPMIDAWTTTGKMPF